MEKTSGILIIYTLLSLCYNNLGVDYFQGTVLRQGVNIRHESSGETRHFITDHDCNIIKEWIDRKSFAQFMKQHISTIRTIDHVIDKMHLNDTFIP